MARGEVEDIGDNKILGLLSVLFNSVRLDIIDKAFIGEYLGRGALIVKIVEYIITIIGLKACSRGLRDIEEYKYEVINEGLR